jgi:hypothetical protein
MTGVADKWRECLHDRKYIISMVFSCLLLITSAFINFFAGIYATERVSSPVTDIVLSNIPVYDVDGMFIYGPIVLILFITWLCFSEPKRIPFIFKSLALFVFIRSGFVSLTHIAPFPTRIGITPSEIISFFTSGNDLFFSGHTGIPFLLALIFWKNPFWRYFFMVLSIFFAVIVLMGHLHYSIDVASAFFITYAIFHIALQLFRKDHVLFEETLVNPVE